MVCSQSDIAAYLDGELDAGAETGLENHLSECLNCFNSMREQKMVLCALNAFLDNRSQIELPVNFAKKVAVEAESGVRGLRNKEERITAFSICAALFGIISVIALIEGTTNSAATLDGPIRIFSSAWLFLTFLYDVGVGLVVIFRALMRSFISDSSLSALGILTLLVLSLVLFSQFYLHFRRIKW